MYKVIQWATGTLGTEALRLTIDDPELELVGLFVYSDSKAGKDAGDLCGRPKTGVKATNKVEEILATKADVVLYYPMLEPTTENSDKEVQALLRSGKNVISIRGHQWPAWRGPAYAKMFDDACKAGNATLCGVGFHPGYVYDRLAVTATGLCSIIKQLDFYEGFDLRTRPPHTIFDVCAMGAEEGTMNVKHPLVLTLTELYSEQLHLMAKNFGTTIKSIVPEVQNVLADRDIPVSSFSTGKEVPCGTVKKGTIKGIRMGWVATLANGTKINQHSHWFIEPIQGWDSRNVWKIKAHGVPSFSMEYVLDKGPDDLPAHDPMNTCLGVLGVNAIPDVCAAPAGIYRAPIIAPWQARYNDRLKK